MTGLGQTLHPQQDLHPPIQHLSLPRCVLFTRVFSSSVLLSNLESSDIKVYGPEIRALLGTASQFCEAVVVESITALEELEVMFPKLAAVARDRVRLNPPPAHPYTIVL